MWLNFNPVSKTKTRRLAAAVPFHGVYDFTDRDGTHPPHRERIMGWVVMPSPPTHDDERWSRASPMTWIGPHTPPFFVLHGTHDTLTSVVQARLFASRLRARSRNPVAYAELPGAHHGFDVVGSVRTLHAARAIDRFLSAVGGRVNDSSHPQAPENVAPGTLADATEIATIGHTPRHVGLRLSPQVRYGR
jgi:acetyl esterase/lipase